MSKFDVWVMRFGSGGPPPGQRLKHAFGLDDTQARAIEQNLPRIVKHAVNAKEAGEMRQVLESIGAEVECRPARIVKPAATAGGAVFHKPLEDLLPGRVSAIDPFDPVTEPGVPRISVEEPAKTRPPSSKSEVSGVVRPPSSAPKKVPVEQLMRERTRAHQRKLFMKRAVGAIVAGVVIIAIDVSVGNSVFLGTADWFGIAFDGLAIYFIGLGLFDLIAELRS